MSESRIAIIGSGILGLALGRLLPGAAVYEKNPFMGGPSRTLAYKGFRFDTGLHFLYDPPKEVLEFLRPILGDAILPIDFFSRVIYLANGYRLSDISTPRAIAQQTSLLDSTRILWDYFYRRAFPRFKKTNEDILINQYGDFFYRRFLEAGMLKITGIPLNQTRPPGRAPPRKTRPLLIRLVLRLMRWKRSSPTPPVEVLYPAPWFGALVEKMAEGLSICCSSELTRIYFMGKRVVGFEINQDGRVLPCNHLILAVPPHLLIDLLDPPSDIRDRAAAIRYRDLIYVVLFFNVEHVMKEYVAHGWGEELFTRAFEPKNWGENVAPPGKTCVCFEIRCSQGNPLWRLPDVEITRRVYRDFHRHYPHAPEPLESLVFRIPRAWLLYEDPLEENLKAVHRFASSFENLHAQSQEHLLSGNSVTSAIQEAQRLAVEIGQPRSDRILQQTLGK